MPDLAFALIWIAILGFLGFNQWLRQKRREMAHRERLAAIEKGLVLPQEERESRRHVWNIERLLLLAGLCWVSVGVTMLIVIGALVGEPLMQLTHDPAVLSPVPAGFQWLGLAPIGIGIAHLAAFVAGKKKVD